MMLGMKAGWIAIACAVITGVGVALYSVNSHTFDNPSLIETRSPQGTYTVSFELKAGEADAVGLFTEFVKLKVTKSSQTFFEKDPFFAGRALEPHFKGAYPVIEWINDSSLRMGGNLASQPFRDEIKLINKTQEKLDVVEIFYGKYERFLIFDLEPELTLTLPASPQVSNGLPLAATVIYEATNFSTKQKRTKVIENFQRKNASEGPLKPVVEIVND
jgi:hypothetical protein